MEAGDRAGLVVVGELVQQPRQHARRELRRRLQRANTLDDVRLARGDAGRRKNSIGVVRQRVEDLGEYQVERRSARVGAAERELAQQPEEADQAARVLLGVEGAQRQSSIRTPDGASAATPRA